MLVTKLMTRKAEYPIDDLFLRRFSPRAMSGAPLAKDELLRLFEAAHWAPSSGNAQPWRFVYALAGTPHFERLYGLLAEGNKLWCARAGALVVVCSRTQADNGRSLRTHSLDTGASWMSFALQGTLQGLVVHGMEGFDYDRARVELELPPGFTVEMMIAVGHPGRIEDLPERYRARETPSDRLPMMSLIHEGKYSETKSQD